MVAHQSVPPPLCLVSNAGLEIHPGFVGQASRQLGSTTARRGLDHAQWQARRRCQRGTHVPMRWRAAPRRDRAHGRPREADANEGSQGQQGTAGARALTVAPGAADHGRSDLGARTAGGAAAMPARHVCADALASSDAPVIGRTADRAKPTRTQVRKASKGLPVPACRRSPRARPTTAGRPRITHRGRRGGDASKARMCRCAGEQRRAGDRAHGRPREADADAGPQGQQGTAGARALLVALGPAPAPSSVEGGQVCADCGRQRGHRGQEEDQCVLNPQLALDS